MTKSLYLIGVIGAGDQKEDPGEGVFGWVGDFPGLRAWIKKEKKTLLHQLTDL